MKLPLLPQDKANHLAYGALIACATSFIGLGTALNVVVSVAILKELTDAVINYRATGNPMLGPHGVEILDALATIAGGVLVLAPQLLKEFV